MEGGLPLSHLILVGHSSPDAWHIGSQGVGEKFYLNTLTNSGRGSDQEGLQSIKEKAWAKPKFRDALAGKFPPAAWFRTDAVVKLVGCFTWAFARAFAETYLRGDAVAWGTSRMILPRPDGKVGWGMLTGAGQHTLAPGTQPESTVERFEIIGVQKRLWVPSYAQNNERGL